MRKEVRAFRPVANRVLRFLFSLLLKIEVVGTDNVPLHGPFIAMMNHIYFLDPILVAVLAPRFIVIMSKIENYRNPLLALIMHLYGCFPIRRGELDMSAIRTSLEVLSQGQGLLMAPEGTRSLTKTLQPGRDGMAMIALRGNAAVVPIALSGQEQLGAIWKRLRRTPVRVVFGKPFYFQTVEGMGHREQLGCMTREAMYQLALMLPAQYRGAYKDVENATTEFLALYALEQD